MLIHDAKVFIANLIPRFSASIFRIAPADRWPGRKFVALLRQETTRKLKIEYVLPIYLAQVFDFMLIVKLLTYILNDNFKDQTYKYF